MSATHSYIGRVGTLAVLLGIGGVIAALPATASADTGATDSGSRQQTQALYWEEWRNFANLHVSYWL